MEISVDLYYKDFINLSLTSTEYDKEDRRFQLSSSLRNYAYLSPEEVRLIIREFEGLYKQMIERIDE